MENKIYTKILLIIIVLSLVGCVTKGNNNMLSPLEEVNNTQTETLIDNQENKNEINPSEETDKAISNKEDIDEFEMSEEEIKKIEEEENEKLLNEEEEKKRTEQLNSFSMMYYLAITAEEIRTSKDNRIVLEEIYTLLLNNVNPGAVDEITQDHLKNLRDIIKSYLNISIKRERLQFIYNQEKAAAMRSAVPNPLAILSVSNAMDWKKLALAVAYTAVDSYNNYKRASESADIAFIMSGWELDDEEKDAVMKNRDRAFDYMVDMVQEYKLDGLKTLNEKSIERFAEICATENAFEKIKRLQAEEAKYNLLGNYWIELADAYFETSQYQKCLESVEKYNSLTTGIYRQDFNYLHILPKVIVAAQETYTGEQYVEIINKFANDILINTSMDDWSLRYFAAQVYLDLYAKTDEQIYLDKAYQITLENVTVLLKEQRNINKTYLADVVEQTVVEPDYRYMTDAEKKEAKKEYKNEQKLTKEYNKALKTIRKTELPSLYEPLVLNCEMLFALADKMNIDDFEKVEIEAILETDNNGVFMVKPINNSYSFSGTKNNNTIGFSKKEIIIPVDLLTANSKIVVTVNEEGTTTKFDDFIVAKVERKGDTIDTFYAHVSSKLMEKYKWTANSKITISITYSDVYDKVAHFKFVVNKFEKHWYGDRVEFKAQ